MPVERMPGLHEDVHPRPHEDACLSADQEGIPLPIIRA